MRGSSNPVVSLWKKEKVGCSLDGVQFPRYLGLDFSPEFHHAEIGMTISRQELRFNVQNFEIVAQNFCDGEAIG